MLQHQQSQSQWGPAPTGPGGFAPPPQPHPQQPVGTTWNPQAPPPPSAPVQHQPGGLYGGGAFANAQYQQNQQYGNYTAQQQSCCPTQQPPGAAPHGYCCNPPMPNEPPMWPLHQMCDITTCAVFFFALMSIIGFGVVLGTTKPDNLFDVYDAKNTAQLQIMMSKHFDFPNMTLVSNETEAPPTPEPTPAPAPPCYCPCNFTTLAPPTTAAPPSTTPALTTTAPSTTHASTVAPAATTRAPTTATPRPSTVAPSNNTRTMTITLPRATSPAATSRRQLEEIPPIRGEWEIPICNYTKGFTGAFGEVCMEETLNAAVMAVNLSRWTAFRGTLYFIAMLGSFLILALIIIVHRVQHPMPQFGQPGAPQQFPMPEPWQFFGTKLYEVFRVVWGAVSVVMFMWIVVEMDTYWRLIGFFKDNTDNDLKAFWRDYDRKFVATVVCGGIYVCWPLCEMALEIALWFAGLIPWFGYRTMCAQGIGQVRFPETPIEELPGCVRVDMFYVDCEQAGRLGFSTRMWEMITGTRAKYLDCLDQCGQPPSGYAGGAVPGGYGGGIASQAPSIVAPRPGSMGGELPAQPTQVTRGFGVPQYGQPVQQPVTVQPPSPEWQGGFNSSQPVATSQSGNFVNQSGAFGGANTSGSFVRSSRSFAADDSSDDDEKKSKKSKKEKSEKKEKHSKKEKSSKKEKKDKS